jgi:hypothetical protein
MNYNLTEKQKELARQIVKHVRSNSLPESFTVYWTGSGAWVQEMENPLIGLNEGELDALFESRLIVQALQYDNGREQSRRCTLTGRAYSGVDTNFTEEESIAPISTLAQPHPPEIGMSIDRLRTKYPDPKKLGFLVMRFTAAKPFARIVEIIKQTAAKYDLIIVRADENEFHADLWGNVRTHLHGCGFGIAVYERIETEEPNANVGLEVGYLMAMNKPVLLLKDKTVATLQADLAGKLYKAFDPHDPENTIPDQLVKWLEDNGIIVPNHP